MEHRAAAHSRATVDGDAMNERLNTVLIAADRLCLYVITFAALSLCGYLLVMRAKDDAKVVDPVCRVILPSKG